MKNIKQLYQSIKSPISDKESLLRPYSVMIKEKTIASDVMPYQLHMQIKYSDLNFKKRIKNLSKSKKIHVDYRQEEKNIGTLLKPNYKWISYISISNQKLSTTTALAIEILVPFNGTTHLTNKAIPLHRFHSGVIYKFETKERRDSLNIELHKSFEEFLSNEYNIFVNIDKFS